MAYNPVDVRRQDVKVVHAGTYVGQLIEGARLTLNATDLPNIHGGMFAAINANGELNLCNGSTETPVGMFYGDGSNPRDVTIIIRGGIYGVKNWLASDIANLVAGAKLTVHTTGQLKALGAGTTMHVATCLQAPADTADYLWIKLEI